MTAPTLTRYIQGQGLISADGLNTFEQTADSAAELRAFIGTVGMQVYLRGLTAPNDGGAGVFEWNASGTGPDDGVFEIVPPGAALGCWTRITATIGSGIVITSGTTITASNADETIVVDKTVGSATTILLPGAPVLWERHTVKDGKGDAATNNITVGGNGNTIDGAASEVITTNFGSITVQFDGVQWLTIAGGVAGSAGPPGPPGPSLSLPGVFTGLKIINNTGTPNTKADITAKSITLGSGSLSAVITNLAVTVDITASGANGLDTGSAAASTVYYLWVIYNSSTATTAGLFSLSSTAPTLPAGYAYSARVGTMYTDGSVNLKRTLQIGQRGQYTLPPLPTIVSGAVGNVTGNATTTWVAESVVGLVPTTVASAILVLSSEGGNTTAMVAPNNAYGNVTSTTNLAPGVLNELTAQTGSITVEFVLESTNVYFSSLGANNRLQILGWTDNLSG